MLSELTNFNNLKKHSIISVIRLGTGILYNIKNQKSIFIFGVKHFQIKKICISNLCLILKLSINLRARKCYQFYILTGSKSQTG